MIRAIFHNGAIRPLDEIPEHWLEGEELTIEQTGGKLGPEELADLDNWVAEVRATCAKISDEDHTRAAAAIAEHRAEAKEWARREMGLSE